MPDREDEARALLREAADALSGWRDACQDFGADVRALNDFLARIKEYLEKDGER